MRLFHQASLGFLDLAILTYKYLVWARENRNPIVIVYLLTTGMICLNSIFTILALNSEFETRPDYIRYARSLSGGFAPGVTTFTKSLDITYALSFLFTWIATAILLYSYYNKTNRLVYWISISVPILYFFTLIQPFVLNLFYNNVSDIIGHMQESPILYSYIPLNLLAEFYLELPFGECP